MTSCLNTVMPVGSDPLSPHYRNRKRIEAGASADIGMCWACSSCDLECPVNVATHMLRPQKLVRMANWGLLDELLSASEIWYCLSCRRCARICPNSVKPSSVVGYIRQEALRRGIVSWRRFRAYCDLYTRFQRARWRAVEFCMQGGIPEVNDNRCQEWMQAFPPEMITDPIRGRAIAAAISKHKQLFEDAGTVPCITCGECGSACPVACNHGIFDPRKLIRMVQLGLVEEAAALPDIWLCLACGRCTEACSQQIDGRAVIEHLRRVAIAQGIVGREFLYLLERTHRHLLSWFLNEVDLLMGHSETVWRFSFQRRHPAARRFERKSDRQWCV